MKTIFATQFRILSAKSLVFSSCKKDVQFQFLHWKFDLKSGCAMYITKIINIKIKFILLFGIDYWLGGIESFFKSKDWNVPEH